MNGNSLDESRRGGKKSDSINQSKNQYYFPNEEELKNDSDLSSNEENEYEQFLKNKKQANLTTCWQRFKEKLPDIDELFSYHTLQELNVLDRRLGQMFGMQKAYLVRKQKEAFMYLKPFGEAFSKIGEQIFIWDSSNVLFSPIEDQAIFIPTKLVIDRNQEVSVCPSEKYKCFRDSDCTRKKFPEINILDSECIFENKEVQQSPKDSNKTIQNFGYCTVKQWCSQQNKEKENIENFNLIMDSYLSFNNEIIRSQSEDGSQIEYPRANPTQFKVKDLLQIAGVTSFSKVREKGAVLIATIIWRCTTEHGCTRGIEVTRMDQSESGYQLTKDEYSTSGQGLNQRTQTQANGIRIFTRAKGFVQEWSIINIVLQISSAIGLLLAARSLTDFIMLNIFREKNHYANMKYVKTERL